MGGVAILGGALMGPLSGLLGGVGAAGGMAGGFGASLGGSTGFGASISSLLSGTSGSLLV